MIPVIVKQSLGYIARSAMRRFTTSDKWKRKFKTRAEKTYLDCLDFIPVRSRLIEIKLFEIFMEKKHTDT